MVKSQKLERVPAFGIWHDSIVTRCEEALLLRDPCALHCWQSTHLRSDVTILSIEEESSTIILKQILVKV